MDVDLHLARSFVTVVQEGPHVGRAAQRLHLSQPALSKQIQRLELSLGVELFHREWRALQLSDAGKFFFEQAQRLLADAVAVTDRTRDAADHEAIRVTVAFVAGAVELASAVLQTTRRQRPDLDVQLTRVDWLDQTACLREDRADLSLVRLPIDERDLQCVALMSEPRLAGFASDHPLATREAVSIRELDGEPIMRTGNQQDYWTVNPRPSGAAPILGPLANTVEEMLAVVATGVCMCITAESLAKKYPGTGIVYVPIPDLSPSSVAIAWRSANPSGLVPGVVELSHQAAVALSSAASSGTAEASNAAHL
jgi:DNA-binding transcriptional LysR family regulator